MSSFLEKVEGYPEIEGGILRATKVHKVLKAMIKLDSIPMDDTYKFTERSQKLLAKWNKVLADDTTGDKEPDKKADSEEKVVDKSIEEPKDKPIEEPKADDLTAAVEGGSKKTDKPEQAVGKPVEEPKAAEAEAEEAKAEEPAADKPAEPVTESAEAAA